MIISYKNNALNEKAITALVAENQGMKVVPFPRFRFDGIKTTKLILLSLSDDGLFQKFISAGILAKQLIKNGLPSSVNEIDVIISDVDPNNPLLAFCAQLGEEFLKAEREVFIKATISVEGPTLVVPPEIEGGNWHIYTLDKKVIFEGKRIEDYLNKDECIITPQEAAYSSKLPDISKNPHAR